jgi:S-adenosylmethionine/arginine decarboxylase-like enzyme
MQEKPDKPYGFELIMDLHGCDVSKFNRESLDNYFAKLCKAIDMQRCELHFWDDVGVPLEDRQTSPHTKGTSAVQFILTSTIVVHTLDLLKTVYINIFSCKPFDKDVAEKITKDWFDAEDCKAHFIERV